MQKVIRTNSADPKFIELVKQLDTYLAIQNGEENDFYAQYNKIDLIKHAIVIELDGEPVACGAIKEVMPGAMEIKRMYTNPNLRNQGLGTQILSALEQWAKELGYQKCMLETGKFLPDAVALYQKNGYQIIPNYGQYVGVETSVCFEKIINKPLDNLFTERLFITSLQTKHSEFITELVNSAGWLKFIGERNIKTSADALNYISKINNAENLTYWVVELKGTNTPIGIVTLIKRDYLDHHDIGFAFLPQYAKHGFALEATKAVLKEVMQKQQFEKMLATTIPENVSSINLLQKLGLQFQEEIEPDGIKLQVFAAQSDKLILS